MFKIPKKKSQTWFFDIIGGVTIFSIVMIIYFIFTSNISIYNNSNFDDIYNEANIISNTLISAGSPINWSSDSIKEAGITNGNYRLNASKLKNLSSLDYSGLKLLLKTRYEYLIFLEDRNSKVLDINGIEYIGKAGLTRDNIKSIEAPDTLISTRRFLIYNSDIICMVIYLWE
ncbi:MAG: hypothetical protein KAK00_10130 [Nanoarchaeota archaeon]|nr:hypothetical protein [Nanoarchaeota archaeon]